jgi:LEA14-like dessication related protein
MSSRRLVAAGLLATLAACASLPRPQPPAVVGASVRVAELRLPSVRLAVDVTLHNPNAQELPVDALEATLALGGADVGRATLERGVRLPAQGDATVPLDVRGDTSVALAQLGSALGAGRGVDYELRGSVRLADGTLLPFRRRGTLPGGR